jgi:hypothetical protein
VQDGVIELPRECVFPGCREDTPRNRVICSGHWKKVPEDLRERVRWAFAHGDMDDVEAAIRAVVDETE